MEKAKREHTTHWDMDYLPVEEVEALYGLNAKSLPEAASNDRSIPQARRWLVVSFCAVALVAVVVALIYYLVSNLA